MRNEMRAYFAMRPFYNLKSTGYSLKCAGAVVLSVCAALTLPSFGGEGVAEIPASLKEWKFAEYTRRFFIKVDAPGDAGGVGLHTDSMFASVMLPLKLIGTGPAALPEPVVLVSEDGVIQPVSAHSAPGASEIEIVFATFPGQRRFCLYAGASRVPKAGQLSPAVLQPTPLMVHLRGMSADASFKALPAAPLTLQRFQQMETANTPLAGMRTLANPDPHPEIQPNIDDAECPFFAINYNIFDVIRTPADIDNPVNYAALYEGFLRCPIPGPYKFAIDTAGVVHMIIDGVEVLGADLPDDHREPFALNKTVALTEGVHRVVVHYAEANATADRGGKKTNADLRRFGLRLHWQPPFSSGFMCIPPLAFVKYLPGIVVAFETAPAKPEPFVNVETLGHVRAAAQKGDGAAREWILVCARGVGLRGTERLQFSAGSALDVSGELGKNILCGWVPAGMPVEFRINDSFSRCVTWPTLKTGIKEFVEREVMDLEAELLVKSAPEFLYPNETGHIHVETVLSPKPVIVHKTRFDAKDFTGWEMLPPPPRPMGEFKLYFEQTHGGSETTTTIYPATPDESERKKIRVSFPANAEQALNGLAHVALRLEMGGVTCQQESFQLLHALAPSWPNRLKLVGGELVAIPKPATVSIQSASSCPRTETPIQNERVIIVVPHEDEASHRRLKPMDVFSKTGSATEALFIGDPLTEGVTLNADHTPSGGLPAALAKARPALKWTAIETAGPHRYRPLLRMLADLDAYGQRLPKLAVLNLGSGDVSRQTPMHIFERSLDTVLARLVAGGVEHIVVVGPIPEPWREKQCEPYQDRVENVVRQHHVSGVDVFHTWTRAEDWTKRFNSGDSSDIAGPLPNAAALDEIVKMISSRL